MIRVDFLRANNIYKQLSVKGHAGFSYYGNDIVCAAVSILVINTVNSIEQFTDDTGNINENDEAGEIVLTLVEHPSDKSILLLDSLALGLEQIKKTYGKKYLQVNYKEV